LLNTVPRFVFPWALALLLLVPWTIWVGARVRSLSPFRKWISVGLRTLMLLALIGALAGAELVKTSDKLAVFFLVDHSNSVPEGTRLAAIEQIRRTCEIYMSSKDEAGLIVFGEEPSIELNVEPTLEFEKILSYVGGEQTDLAASIRLALAAFPQGYMKRIVAYTDGNETRGAALEEAKLAQAAGAEVNLVPLAIGQPQEVRVREVTAPSRVSTDEPFQLRAVVYAEQDCEATIRVFQRVAGDAPLPMRPQTVTLQAGDNTFLLPQELRRPGFYEYEVLVESDADTVLANNEGRAYTVIQGEPVVLYVEANPEHSTRLGPALEAEGLLVDEHNPGTMPMSLALLQNYDAIVLSDVSSTDFSIEHMKLVEALVRDFGIGLVMVGGPNSYGAGGYLDTPIERALPVDMDLKQRKILPRGALILIMHTCEMPDANAWARDISLAALQVLSSQDFMGALGYMPGGDNWIFPLDLVRDKSMMTQRLKQASTQIGDMPAVEPTLRMAYDALANADAAAKRVIMISDGDPQAPSRGLLKRLADAKIAVSTVCISPHSANDQGMLQWVAKSTGGEYYYVTNPRNLPQIFIKEAAVVKRGMLIEEEFVPKPKHSSELLFGLADDGLPVLRGYVATMPKDSATVPLVSHEDDPILAHWRYGLGKSVAFTSDVTSRWATDWLRWQGFNAFWAKTVRWAMRETSPTTFRVDTFARDGLGHIRVDAVDDQGRFVNFLRPEGAVTGPAPDFARQQVDLIQTGPGIYEGAFPLDNRGVYMVNLTYVNQDGSQGMLPTGLALGYSREYEYNTTNLPLLEQIAAAGGGAIVDPSDDPFQHTLVATPTVTPVWQYLVVFAACVFPFEIFFRRVVINFNAVYLWAIVLLRKLPPLGRLIPAPARKERPLTGFYGAAPSREFEYADAEAAPIRSFGLVVEERPMAVGETPAPGTPQAAAQRTAGRTEYTQKLLAAKARALAQRKKGRDGDKKDKENP